ncbi:hypothetical protein ALC62_15372 [Cyphomyrmex costatus]|uniref:DDE Tnp4 domain-containing protein n=1 Tax=Cyphomyrmex costatus TaxID=456900 RepID=A0A151I767_9HYME|nr:hypothetical protein ALC62_15372 [Cyphomyrmex costatus]
MNLTEVAHIKPPRRYIRDFEDPFEFFCAKAFKQRYRFSKEAVIYELGFSQPTVCRCVKAVSILFAEKLHECIEFPLESQRNNIRRYEIARFPNVAACIEGTLIKMISPGKEIGEIFRSRKSFSSLNVLVSCGANKRRRRRMLDGYGCQPYLLTPIQQPLNQAERNYNRSHKKTRSHIERIFGQWEKKFSCLHRGLSNKLDTSIGIICATAVLWNLHIHINCRNENISVNEMDNAIYLDTDPPRDMNGLEDRLQFTIRHFSI